MRLIVGVILIVSAPVDAVAGSDASRPPRRAAFDWSGFYLGANLGGAAPVSRFERLQALGFGRNVFDLYPASSRRPGLTFGAQLGYNWQYKSLVYGLETELNFLDGQKGPSGSSITPPSYWPAGVNWHTLTAGPSGTYFATLRGRAGIANGPALFYLTGGIATGGWRGASTLMLNGRGAGVLFSSDISMSDRMKFLFGGGVEYALDANWSARAEYLFLNQSYNTQAFGNGTSLGFLSKAWANSHILRFGMNYRLPQENSAEGASDKSRRESSSEMEAANVHGQITVLPQGYPKFRALYSGPHSLQPSGEIRATGSSTAFFGLRLWEGGEAYVNPEIDVGYGVSNTFGVAGFPSSEAYKLGRSAPYLRLNRYFLRQTAGLGGDTEKIDSGQNQLAGKVDANRLTFTVGKYSVVDIFDDNKYAHDGRNGFMNWSVIDMGAFDYAADVWSFTYGATAEWRQNWWTGRVGVFQLSRVPNSPEIEPVLFRQFSQVAELEARYSLFGRTGKIRLLGYGDLASMGKYDEAIANGHLTGTTPDVSLIRKKRYKAGGGVNIEQAITDDLGVFLRASTSNGRYETYEFTEVESSLSAGAVLSGKPWGRPNDAIGVAGAVNGISNNHANYLAAGGLGIMLGDGRLNYGGEHILEAYYKYSIADGIHLTGDFQFVDNPGYNRDRGPVPIFGLRLHGEF